MHFWGLWHRAFVIEVISWRVHQSILWEIPPNLLLFTLWPKYWTRSNVLWISTYWGTVCQESRVVETLEHAYFWSKYLSRTLWLDIVSEPWILSIGFEMCVRPSYPGSTELEESSMNFNNLDSRQVVGSCGGFGHARYICHFRSRVRKQTLISTQKVEGLPLERSSPGWLLGTCQG